MRYIAIIILVILAILGESWGGAAQGTIPTQGTIPAVAEYRIMLPMIYGGEK